jgi:hypothetical protein
MAGLERKERKEKQQESAKKWQFQLTCKVSTMQGVETRE